jgi:hypothetical protein
LRSKYIGYGILSMRESVVLYGALRSGTTIVRLILDGHPDIRCSGEHDYIFDHVEGETIDTDAQRSDYTTPEGARTLPAPLKIADLIAREVGSHGKRLTVFVCHRNLERVLEALPDAKVIHLVRDPRDVAKSSIPMGWAANTWFGVDHWIGTEREWDAADKPAEVNELRYEALVRDPQGTVQGISAFLGLPYDPVMLDVGARSSYQPIRQGVSKDWRQEQSQREVADTEHRVGDLLERRGYMPSGYGLGYPTPWRRLWLGLSNRVGRWQHAASRYGVADYLLVKVASATGLRFLGRGADKRMKAAWERHLA